MSKYIFEWANGNKSGISFTKQDAKKGLEHYYNNHEGWNYIVVKNIETLREDVFFEEWDLKTVNEINC